MQNNGTPNCLPWGPQKLGADQAACGLEANDRVLNLGDSRSPVAAGAGSLGKLRSPKVAGHEVRLSKV